ncbi:MAG TPA: hypothetical protein VJK53_06090, partial [Candidatus Paceibacterota bacterium]
MAQPTPGLDEPPVAGTPVPWLSCGPVTAGTSFAYKDANMRYRTVAMLLAFVMVTTVTGAAAA